MKTQASRRAGASKSIFGPGPQNKATTIAREKLFILLPVRLEGHTTRYANQPAAKILLTLSRLIFARLESRLGVSPCLFFSIAPS